MGKIVKLEPNVFNMLAAGEVVERPASVVKELVENAVDAGADEIYIDIENGGLRKISVSDNGVGILKDDLRAAFLPHATSKIKSIDDLNLLSTLGFRGEALASIAAVSEVTVISHARGENDAAKLVLSGGNVVLESEDSRVSGTSVTVENLFFNTPARLKFLKKPSTEQRYILDIVRTLVLANPQMSVYLSDIEDGNLLSHIGGDLKSAVGDVYGANILKDMLEVDGAYGDIKVSGYISAPSLTKANRTYQTLIVNGRPVKDDALVTAVERAYGELLMKRSYPLFAIEIVMPFDEVDANVHPQKTEVRFLDRQKVFSAVYHSVKDALQKADGVGSVAFGNGESGDAYPKPFRPASFHLSAAATTARKTPPSNLSFADIAAATIKTENTTEFSPIVPVKRGNERGIGGLKESALTDDYTAYEPQIEFFDGKIVGQIFDTYIVVERGDALYIIDQHAAHERILYDRIVERFKVEYAQPLLIPCKLLLNAEEREHLENLIPQLESFGFEFKHTNGSVLITAVPEPLTKLDFSSFFREIFSNLHDSSEITPASLMKEKLCQWACKGAIKGGERLSDAQIALVLKHYLDDGGNLPEKCPHGRPAVICVRKSDIEKLFKRIV